MFVTIILEKLFTFIIRISLKFLNKGQKSLVYKING